MSSQNLKNYKGAKNCLLLTGSLLLSCLAMAVNAAIGEKVPSSTPNLAASADNNAYKGSQANNKTLTSLKESVNEATGEFSATLSLLSVKGYIPLKLSITYSAGTPGLLGLPRGWSYNIDFVNPGKSVTYNGTTYLIDPNWQDNSGYRSGLKYLNQHGLRFVDKGSQVLPGSYQQEGYEHDYRYLLSFPDGSNDYFDAVGKLIAKDDRFGNHILYAYANPNAPVYDTVLLSVRDSLGQTFNLSNQSGQLLLTFTDSMKQKHNQKVVYDAEGVRDYINALGDNTRINYTSHDNIDVISDISYPNGLQTTVHYQNLPFKTERGRSGNLPAVSEVVHYDVTQKKVVSDVYYSGYSNLNYTGYPYYALSHGRDSLLENARKMSYRYTVNKLTMVSAGHSLRTETIYNADSQPVDILTYLPGDKDGKPTYRTVLTYKEDPNNHARTVNYDKPEEVDSQVLNTEEGSYRTLVKTKMTYDLYGDNLTAEQYSYQPLLKKLVEISKTTDTYSEHYHLPLTQTTLLWQPLGNSWKTIETDNTLTSDNKSVATHSLSMNGQPWKKSVYTYDTHGLRRSATLSWLSKGHSGVDDIKTTIDYQFDVDHHLETITATNALGFSSQKIVDTTDNDVLQTITPQGESTLYDYDLGNRLLSETYPDKNKTTFLYTDYQHDQHNSVLKTSPLGFKHKVETDALGRPVYIWMNTDDEHPSDMVLQAVNSYNKAGKISTKQDVLGNETTYVYNALGLVTSMVDKYQNKTAIDYNYLASSKTVSVNGIKQATTVTDPTKKVVEEIVYPNSHNPNKVDYNRVSTFYYSGGHHLIEKRLSAQNPDSGSLTTLRSTVFDYNPDYKVSEEKALQGDTRITVKYDYDLISDLLSASKQINDDPVIRRDQYQYNAAGELVSDVWADGSSVNYQYNPDGLLKKTVMADGSAVSYSYDSNGREIKRDWQDNQGQKHSLVSAYNADGKRTSESLDNSLETFGYDFSGNLTRKTHCISSDCQQKKQSVYIYNKYGQMQSTSDANGVVTQYAYNRQGQIHNVSNPHNSIIYHYSTPLDPNENKQYGQLETTNNVGLYQTKTVEDALGRPFKTDKTDSSGKVILSLKNHYDELDQLTEVKSTSTLYPDNTDLNYTSDFIYDDLGRLIQERRQTVQASQNSTIAYQYDDNDNLLKRIQDNDTLLRIAQHRVETDYLYNNLDQLTMYSTGDNTFHPQYDKNGRETSNGSGQAYQYNTLGQLVTVQTGKGNPVHYTYSPDGLRSTRTSAEGAYHYYYQGSQINAIGSPDNSKTSFFLAGNRRVSGDTTGPDNAVKSLYYVNDNKSNVLTLNPSGQHQHTNQQTNQWASDEMTSTFYSPYGQQNKTLKTTVATNFTYNGEYEDPATDLVYLRSRDYDPTTERFITMDSCHKWNKYDFADANPIMNIDPSGHSSVLNYILNGLAVVGSVAAAAIGQPETLAGSVALLAASASGVASGVTGITAQAIVDTHAKGANSSAVKALSASSWALAIPGLVVTAYDAGAFIAGKLAARSAALITSGPMSVADIIKHGKEIGSGLEGIAFRVRQYVYKVFDNPYKNWASDAERSARVLNEINQEVPVNASVIKLASGETVLRTDYIAGRQATTAELFDANSFLIRTYNRVMLDDSAAGNILMVDTPQGSRPVFIDPGLVVSTGKDLDTMSVRSRELAKRTRSYIRWQFRGVNSQANVPEY